MNYNLLGYSILESSPTSLNYLQSVVAGVFKIPVRNEMSYRIKGFLETSVGISVSDVLCMNNKTRWKVVNNDRLGNVELVSVGFVFLDGLYGPCQVVGMIPAKAEHVSEVQNSV